MINDRAGGLYIERNGSNYGLSAFVNTGGYGIIGSNGTYTTDVLTMDLNVGNVILGINSWLQGYATGSSTQNLIRSRAMGYPGYYGLQIGQETNHIALFI